MNDLESRFRAGEALGDAILACFEAIAEMDGTSRNEVIDEWVSTYVAERILEER